MKKCTRHRRIRAAGICLIIGIGLASCVSSPAPQTSPEPSATPAVTDASTSPVSWTEEALALFQAEVPKMVQKIAKKEMEKQARAQGKTEIDTAFYEEQKAAAGH